MGLIKKKLCFIVSSSLTAKAFLWNHIEELSAEMDIYLVGNFSKDDKVSLSKLPISRIHSIPIPRNVSIIKDFRALLLLGMFFRKEQFNFIHSVTPKAGLLSMIAGSVVGIRTRIHIFTGQIWHTKKGLFRILLKTLDKVIVFFATNILVDGKGQMEYLINNGIVQKEGIQLLAHGSINGVDTKIFSPNDAERKKMREQLGICDDKVVVLYLGRLKKDKGIVDLISAFQEIKNNVNSPFLLLVGYDEEEMTKRAISSLGIGSYKIVGPTSTPVSFYQAADIFCLPSYREGFGTSVIEASSVGLAVLCSDTYGLKDTIVEDVTGIRHEVGNVKDISSKLTILLNDSHLRVELGNNGRKYIIANFESEIVTKAWANYYRSLT